MKAPESLETLIDYGIIQEVVRPLMSGKEAQVYVVLVGGKECVAKVYKEARHRSFKHRSEYTEGRRTRNSRDQRAIAKHTQHGRKKDEDAWRSTEVDMIHRLRDVGVPVPEPINFVDGVLVMELIRDSEGRAAPRLGDLTFSPEEARAIHETLIRAVVRMLCAGVIHGDLSEFNVLMAAEGPVVIDFPQSIDPTQNPNGERLLRRDVENLQRFLSGFVPEATLPPYGEEIWALFQTNRLEPDVQLTGRVTRPKAKADTAEVLALIDDAKRDERMRHVGRDWEESDLDAPAQSPVVPSRSAAGNSPSPFRRVVDFTVDERARRPSSHGRRRPPSERPIGERLVAKGPNAPRPSNAARPHARTGPAVEGAKKDKASVPRRRRRRSRKPQSPR